MAGYDDLTVTQLQQESARIESQISELERTVADLRASFGTIRSELAKRLRPSPEPRCSEHALLRFIERVYGVNIDAARAEIMTPAVVAALKAGVTAVTVKGVKMLAKEGVIVTVVTNEMKNEGKHKRTRAYETDEDEAA
jgi:DNA gyrase/topoisomerase IV subunit A